jgi:hypothetical protein
MDFEGESSGLAEKGRESLSSLAAEVVFMRAARGEGLWGIEAE